MARLSGWLLLALSVMCLAMNCAADKSYVASTGEKICIPMEECKNAENWYLDGYKYNGTTFNQQNQMCIDYLTLGKTGAYSCGTSHSVHLHVVQMRRAPTILTRINSGQVPSLLKTRLNDVVEVDCSMDYYKFDLSGEWPLKMRWTSLGLEGSQHVTRHQVDEETGSKATSTLVMVTSNLKVDVQAASPDASITCEAVTEEGKIFSSTTVNVQVAGLTSATTENPIPEIPELPSDETPAVAPESNPSVLNLAEVNPSELSQSESTLLEPETSQTHLVILSSGILAVLLVLGVAGLALNRWRKVWWPSKSPTLPQ